MRIAPQAFSAPDPSDAATAHAKPGVAGLYSDDDIIRFKVIVFVIACALAGMTGSLQGHYIKFVGPDAYSGFQSLNLVVMNVIGGMTSLAGALIGTVFMVTLPELLRGYVNLQQIMFGAILFATMAFLPGGIIEAIRRIRALLKPSKPGLAT